jgi:hypothetical protein
LSEIAALLMAFLASNEGRLWNSSILSSLF